MREIRSKLTVAESPGAMLSIVARRLADDRRAADVARIQIEADEVGRRLRRVGDRDVERVRLAGVDHFRMREGQRERRIADEHGAGGAAANRHRTDRQAVAACRSSPSRRRGCPRAVPSTRYSALPVSPGPSVPMSSAVPSWPSAPGWTTSLMRGGLAAPPSAPCAADRRRIRRPGRCPAAARSRPRDRRPRGSSRPARRCRPSASR